MRGPWGTFSAKEEEQVKRTTSDRALIERMFPYAAKYKKNLLIGIVSIVLGSLAGLASPYMHGMAIDQIIVPGNLSGFVWWIPVFVFIVLGSYALQYVQTFQMRVVGENVVATMRDEIMEKLQVISLRYFSEGEIGRIISRPVNDANTVRIFLRMGLTNMLLDTSSILGSFIIMFALDYRLATLAIVMLPVSLIAVWYLGKYSRAAYRRALATTAGLTARMQEDLAGIKVIQSLVREREAKQEFEKQQDATVKANARATLISSAYMPVVMFFRLVGTVVILWYGTQLVEAGAMTVGILVAFTEYQFSYFMPLMDLMSTYDQYQSAMAAIERLFDLIDTRVEVVEAPVERRTELK
jgi:ATP-binding cassette subfamily B protein